jgi:hypothetical protein
MITVKDLIEYLQHMQGQYKDGDKLPVITDSEQPVIAVEFNDTEGAPACVLVLGDE